MSGLQKENSQKKSKKQFVAQVLKPRKRRENLFVCGKCNFYGEIYPESSLSIRKLTERYF
jgi:hypothetical protein